MKPALNRDIPGQMRDDELHQIIDLASSVPEGGTIVEVGCLYGLSAWHMAKHAARGVTVFCFDPWVREDWIIKLVEEPQGAPPFSREAFNSYTADCPNIVAVQGYSPDVALDWDRPIDLYFEDAVHVNPYLKSNIDFWSDKVRIGGTIAGHDYTHHHPDVITEADALSAQQGSELTVVGTVWSLEKRVASPKNVVAITYPRTPRNLWHLLTKQPLLSSKHP